MYNTITYFLDDGLKKLLKSCILGLKSKTWAGSLNQDAATTTASSETILKAAHLRAIFKRKMAVGSRKNPLHRLSGSSHLPLQVSLKRYSIVFGSPLPFFF